jgi:hypothetical protein
MKRASEKFSSRGKRKLSRQMFMDFPQEIISAFAQLPRVFKKVDMDRILGDRISRSMKWRYIRRMEKVGLVRHATKKYYQKVYDRMSDWLEKDAIPRVRNVEYHAMLNLDKSQSSAAPRKLF